MKFWVYGGKTGQSPCLLAAVSRIVDGLLDMARRPYLCNMQTKSLFKIVTNLQCQPVRELFMMLSSALTFKAFEAMWLSYQKNQLKFDARAGMDGEYLVTHKKFGDEHVVDRGACYDPACASRQDGMLRLGVCHCARVVCASQSLDASLLRPDDVGGVATPA